MQGQVASTPLESDQGELLSWPQRGATLGPCCSPLTVDHLASLHSP